MLRVDSIWVEVGGLPIVKGVTLDVDKEQVGGILGPNGAGKTTLLHAISGIVPCRRGTIEFLERRIDGVGAADIVRLGIGHVPQNRELFPDLSVRENLELGALGCGTGRDLQKRLERVFTYFPVLRSRLRQLAGTLSGGEQQMLAIGRALMGSPRLLMLDEPSGGLAPQFVASIGELIKQLRREGITVLVVEQNFSLAMEVCDYVYVLVNGQIRARGPVEEARSRWDLAALYLG